MLPWLFCLPCIALSSTSLVRLEVPSDASSRTNLDYRVHHTPKVTSTAGSSRIPHQYITTGHYALSNLSHEFRDNINRVTGMNPGMRLRYLSDQDCYDYLQKHYNETELPTFYKKENIGMYRGDICRAAVLAKEGGYYLDMDIYPLVPFEEFTRPEVTFMTVLTMGRTALLNAMMAATPGHPILLDSLKAIPEWYRTQGHWNLTGQLGMGATWDGLSKFLSNNCPTMAVTGISAPVPCGKDDSIELFDEVWCDKNGHTCPADRQESIVKDGIYDSTGRQIAWSRFSTCKTFSCGVTGRQEQSAGVSFSEAQLKKQMLLGIQ